jgi:NADPH:quinone reductase-like Zn-dependent oxidoreductase
MKAIVQESYGSPEVLQLREIGRPVVKDGEVLVRVQAAAVNVNDWLILRGRPYLVRPAFGAAPSGDQGAGQRRRRAGGRGWPEGEAAEAWR